MRNEQRESFRKWVTLAVAILALVPAYLMGPIAFTFKTTVKDLLRQELADHETIATSDTRWKVYQEREREVFKRWENDLVAFREKAVQTETNNYKLMLEVSSRLSALEKKLDLLISEHQRGGKPPTGNVLP